MSDTNQAMADAFQVYLDSSGIDGTYAFLSGLDRRLAECWKAAWEAAMENAARICEQQRIGIDAFGTHRLSRWIDAGNVRRGYQGGGKAMNMGKVVGML